MRRYMYMFVNLVHMSTAYSHEVMSRYMCVIMVDMSTARAVVRKLYVGYIDFSIINMD